MEHPRGGRRGCAAWKRSRHGIAGGKPGSVQRGVRRVSGGSRFGDADVGSTRSLIRLQLAAVSASPDRRSAGRRALPRVRRLLISAGARRRYESGGSVGAVGALARLRDPRPGWPRRYAAEDLARDRRACSRRTGGSSRPWTPRAYRRRWRGSRSAVAEAGYAWREGRGRGGGRLHVLRRSDAPKAAARRAAAGGGYRLPLAWAAGGSRARGDRRHDLRRAARSDRGPST